MRRPAALVVPLVCAALAASVGAAAPAAGSAPARDVAAVPAAVTSADTAPDTADDLATYVWAVYGDLFHRDPDPSGLATWTARIASGTPRIAVANAITGSEEFRSGLIANAYDLYLDRGPDASGRRYWLDQMAHGWTIERIEAGFVASDEFWRECGATPAGWVTGLYESVLDREPAPSEVSWWSAYLAGGASRGAVAMGFLLSTEHLSSVVDGYYQWLLGRGLDPSGQRAWVGAIQAGGRDETIIGEIVASDEYWRLVTEPTAAGLVLDPADATVAFGGSQTYTVHLVDRRGVDLADVTSSAVLALDGSTTRCAGVTCTPAAVGVGVVTAQVDGFTGSATLTMDPQGPPAKQVLVWGNAQDAALGTGNADYVATPTVRQPEVDSWASIDASFGVRTDGTLWAWGRNDYGSLGLGALDFATRWSPVQVGTDRNWTVVSGGNGVTYGIRDDGSLWGWGYQDGSDHGANGVPTTLGGLATQIGTGTWRDVDAGALTAAIADDGSLWAWGVVCPSCASVGSPSRALAMSQIATGTWAGISTGGATLVAVRADGTLWGLGSNSYHALDPAPGSLDLPTLTRLGPPDWRWVSASTDGAVTLAVRSDGTLWSWGYPAYGVLGTGDREPRSTMVQVGTATTWVSAAPTGGLGVGLQSDGSLWTWGDGRLDQALVPQRLPGSWSAFAPSGWSGVVGLGG